MRFDSTALNHSLTKVYNVLPDVTIYYFILAIEQSEKSLALFSEVPNRLEIIINRQKDKVDFSLGIHCDGL